MTDASDWFERLAAADVSARKLTAAPGVVETVVDSPTTLMKLHDDYSVTVAAHVRYSQIPALIEDLWRLHQVSQGKEVEASPEYRKALAAL